MRWIAPILVLLWLSGSVAQAQLAPASLCLAGKDGSQCLVLGSVEPRALLLDAVTGDVQRTISLPAPATGAVVRAGIAFITTLEPAGRVLEVDLGSGAIRREYRAGHTPMSPVLSPDGQWLYVANRFDGTIARIELASGAVATVPAVREPVALALGAGGGRLFVANHLPEVRPFEDEDNPVIAAEVTVIDSLQWRVLRNISLPNGSQSVRGIALSPDGEWVVVTHVLSNYTRPAWDIAKGQMNRNAISVLDVAALEWVATVTLDDPDKGAANPWAVAFAEGGRRLLVTHAGTHELSSIDFPALLQRVTSKKLAVARNCGEDADLLRGIRQRLPLPVAGPRALAVCSSIAYVAGYFSGNLVRIDLRSGEAVASLVTLETNAGASLAWLGEASFHDATWCRGQWQSCATCHPDGRSDTLYWDLLNDGLGNTKNTRSLLMSALTSPVMWRGVRSDVKAGIWGGIEHILFGQPEPGKIEAIAAYLRAMCVVPSPHLNSAALETPMTEEPGCAKCHLPGVRRGTLTASARRGKAIFEGKAGCAECHPHPLFTTRKQADPGLGAGVPYNVPSLIEAWRTAPYLHSGDALTLRETVVDHNFLGKRGHTKDLSEPELADLLEYVASL